ncbi:MAG: pyridoxal-phosphate dependent enzyme [Bacteroidota bacterium]
MESELKIPSPIQKVRTQLTDKFKIEFHVKRDDLIHPHISGNKWRKLSENISYMQRKNKEGILSFGGAHSNHLYALAAAGKHLGFKTIGLVRGEEVSNATLAYCGSTGMHLKYVDRTTYRQKEDPSFMEVLQSQYPNYFLVPEGGANSLGRKGCKVIMDEINSTGAYNYIFLAAGTGTTAAGMIPFLMDSTQLGIIPVLKGGWMKEAIEKVMEKSIPKNTHFFNDYHFGGYAKKNDELMEFINGFTLETGIPIEYVYTGKLFYGVMDLVKQGYFKEGSRVLVYHSGGLR